jgi:hypothetical protein
MCAMDFEWSQEQQELRQLAREFAENEIAPHVAEYDRDEQFPVEIVKAAAALGFGGGIVPPEYGGAGLDYVTYTGLIEEISRVCHIVGCALTFPSGLVGNSILTYGTEEQKQQYLKPLALGETFAGAGVTEARSGTDVSDMDTTAKKDGSDYIINGAKMWISFLGVSTYYLTFAHLGVDEQTGRKKICAFIVDADLPGVSWHPLKNKYGFRPLSTGELVLENVRVPASALLGEEGQGFEIAMNSVESGRLGVAARAVGLSQACCDAAISYAKERLVFKQPVGKFQMVQEMISDMVCGTESARLLTLKLAHMKDHGQRARGAASIAKMTASDVALKSATDAFQIHGAYGVSDEYPVARYLRDAKVFQIVEGNNQLHKALVAESVLGFR